MAKRTQQPAEAPETTDNIEQQVPETPAGNSDNGSDLGDFIKQMKRPREKIESSGVEFPDEEDDELNDDPAPSQGSAPTTIQLEYDQEDLITAELGLVMFDEVHAGALSYYTGQNYERYKTKKSQINQGPVDYKTQLAAALIHKYKVKTSLEAQFIGAMVASHFPIWMLAYQDRNERLRKEDQDRIRAEAERLRNTANKPEIK